MPAAPAGLILREAEAEDVPASGEIADKPGYRHGTRFGFVQEGVLRACACRAGRYADCLTMARLRALP